ncbi:TPA: hypothetical protein RG888_004303, partial [Pseudomonas aeruginosa]
RPRLFATIPPRKPGLSANEPAIIRADLQSIAANQDYLRMKWAGHTGSPVETLKMPLLVSKTGRLPVFTRPGPNLMAYSEVSLRSRRSP